MKPHQLGLGGGFAHHHAPAQISLWQFSSGTPKWIDQWFRFTNICLDNHKKFTRNPKPYKDDTKYTKKAPTKCK